MTAYSILENNLLNLEKMVWECLNQLIKKQPAKNAAFLYYHRYIL